jgi:hypothetical protein
MFLSACQVQSCLDTYTTVSPSIVTTTVDENTLASPSPTSPPPPHPTYTGDLVFCCTCESLSLVPTSLSLISSRSLPRASSEDCLSWQLGSLPCATSKRGTAARLSVGLGWRLQVLDGTVGPLRSSRQEPDPWFQRAACYTPAKPRTILTPCT